MTHTEKLIGLCPVRRDPMLAEGMAVRIPLSEEEGHQIQGELTTDLLPYFSAGREQIEKIGSEIKPGKKGAMGGG